MKEFMRPKTVAKIYFEDVDAAPQHRRKFLGVIKRMHRGKDEYAVLDYRNGETHYFESWPLAHKYVRSQICWHAYYICGKKEFYDESVFTL